VHDLSVRADRARYLFGPERSDVPRNGVSGVLERELRRNVVETSGNRTLRLRHNGLLSGVANLSRPDAESNTEYTFVTWPPLRHRRPLGPNDDRHPEQGSETSGRQWRLAGLRRIVWPMGAAAAAIVIAERRIVEAFENAGAISAGTARSPDEVGADALSLSWRRLTNRAIIREAIPGSGLYYLDRPSWQALRRTRRRLLVVVLLILLAVWLYVATMGLLHSAVRATKV